VCKKDLQALVGARNNSNYRSYNKKVKNVEKTGAGEVCQQLAVALIRTLQVLLLTDYVYNQLFS
jgi:hypothetical protein